MKDDEHKPEVLGISIAREESAARGHIQAYSNACMGGETSAGIRICDRFRSGYGQYDEAIADCIRQMMARHGIPLDGTYTAKAWHGMKVLAKEENWQNEQILFIHTGGTPLFFDSQR